MSRPRSIPGYRRHAASGQAIVEINGKTYYLGSFGSKESKSKYDNIVAEYLAEGRSSTFRSGPPTIVMANIFLKFLLHAKGYYGTDRNSKYFNYKRLIARLSARYERLPPDQFGTAQFKEFRQTLIDTGLARTYINDQMKKLVRILRWAASEELLDPSIPHRLSMIEGLKVGRSMARETDPVKPVNQADVEAVLPYLPPMVADIVRLQRITGARPAELCGLKVSEINTNDEVWKAQLSHHKNAHRHKCRVVYFGPKAKAILAVYLKNSKGDYVFSPEVSETLRREKAHQNRKTSISCGNRPGKNLSQNRRRPPGDHYEVASYRRAIHRACDKAGVERWSPNQLRHLYATEIRKEHGLEAASILLGHAKPDTTLIYAERDEQKAMSIAAQVG